ncbi:hypothetical protein CANARDRAFT_193875 [[Candida] arabinofermentans NRRL YB-2248]|uniref:TLC domain-containing protein n=1 Tax=[Candida] arabinofermentans NRRL YB-2248 TaxID=983967 RepID=A0A1E4T7N8_9ASCO|nr:hypothetical protein CANARDRAFT_193875 [[Candida] arabinofermentans NRRL YB-2248]
MLIAPFINAKLWGTTYTELTNKKRKINFDIHIVAFIQSLVSIGICIPMFNHPMMHSDPVFGSYDFGVFCASITCGYFIWDLFYCCIWHFDLFGFEYLFHAFAALVVFGTSLYPFCLPCVPVFLIFELSSPFVNIHWFLSRVPSGTVSDRFFLINGLLLMTTFFFSRIVWGFYAAVKMFLICYSVKDQLPVYIIPMIFTLNIGLNYLNVVWFTKMVSIASKKMAKTKESDKVK